MTKQNWITAFAAAFVATLVGAGIGDAVGEEPQGAGAVMITLGRIF